MMTSPPRNLLHLLRSHLCLKHLPYLVPKKPKYVQVTLIPNHALKMPLVVPRFFTIQDDETKLKPRYGTDILDDVEFFIGKPNADKPHGGFVASNPVTTIGLLLFGFNYSRPGRSVSAMLLFNMNIAVIRPQAATMASLSYFLNFAYGGSKLLTLIFRDAVSTPKPRFYFDQGVVTLVTLAILSKRIAGHGCHDLVNPDGDDFARMNAKFLKGWMDTEEQDSS